MLHLQQHLGDTGDSGCRLQVSDVGLGGTQRAELLVRSMFRERAREARDFDRVAKRRARTVRLDVADRACRHTCIPNCPGNDL